MGHSIHRSLFAQQANIRNVKRLQNAQVLLKDPFSTPGHVQQISLVYSILRNSLTVIGLHRFFWHMQDFWKQCVVRLLRRSTRFHCKSCCSTLPLVLLPSKRNKNSPGSPHLKFKIRLSISMAMYPGICDPTVGKNLASLRFFFRFSGLTLLESSIRTTVQRQGRGPKSSSSPPRWIASPKQPLRRTNILRTTGATTRKKTRHDALHGWNPQERLFFMDPNGEFHPTWNHFWGLNPKSSWGPNSSPWNKAQKEGVLFQCLVGSGCCTTHECLQIWVKFSESIHLEQNLRRKWDWMATALSQN